MLFSPNVRDPVPVTLIVRYELLCAGTALLNDSVWSPQWPLSFRQFVHGKSSLGINVHDFWVILSPKK